MLQRLHFCWPSSSLGPVSPGRDSSGDEVLEVFYFCIFIVFISETWTNPPSALIRYDHFFVQLREVSDLSCNFNHKIVKQWLRITRSADVKKATKTGNPVFWILYAYFSCKIADANLCAVLFSKCLLCCVIFILFVVVSMTTKEPNRMDIIYDILVHLILRFQSFVPLCVLVFHQLSQWIGGFLPNFPDRTRKFSW